MGNQIGAMNINLAKRYFKVLFLETFIIGMLVATLLFSLREPLIRLFTDDKELTELCLSVMPFLCWFGIPLDSLPFTGGIRALGLQNMASVVSICVYYLISLPLGAIFAFGCDLKLNGFWYGQYTGVAVQCIALAIILMRADWRRLAVDAQHRRQQSS